MAGADESIPFTMQAALRLLTVDEAAASGTADPADEPAMIRFPVTVNVIVPTHLLYPPELATHRDREHQPAVTDPRARRRHTRFRSRPRGAVGVAAHFRLTDDPEPAG
ncbi:hypothetical protein [Lichenicoccus roseus]|uniref:Uncharacterized protein n=1 Tax=Lichenicoccus roseus TaxID=2683649 RepID=A0A5R9J850_9PROT|nr:hypothetical protein [Lichenicoccus roseus]TLU71526.1 hypothetical protein FE263_16725 [Lichenicoccus roseus]